jgi:predicted nucleic acid-binding protein
VTSANRLPNIPSGTRAIFDSNVLVYWVLDHPHFGNSCEEAIRRVEDGEILGVIPAVVLNELLHRLMIAEAFEKSLVSSPQEAVSQLKSNPDIISELSVAWEVHQTLTKMPFELVDNAKGLTDLTFYFSKELKLMAKDAAITAFAHSLQIEHIISNDRDFDRVLWMTRWKP